MPIPKPNPEEEKDKYISRCMGDEAMQEYDQDQRAAICYRTWEDKDKKTMDETLSEVKDGLVRIAIAVTGDFEKDGRPFTISESDLKQMADHLKTREVPLDYEHLSADPNAAPGHTRASGWLKAPDKIENFGNDRKILWGWAEFTPPCLMAIKQKEYRYFSPEIHWNERDQTGKNIGTRLAAGAITNAGTG